VCTLVATLAVYGLARRLTSLRAALLGTTVFAVSGPVLFQAHFATYDAMMMALVAVAAWLAVRSLQQDRFLQGPVVGLVLAMAALTKYAGLVYAPLVLALVVALGWSRLRIVVLRRALGAAAAMAAVLFFLVALWGQSLIPGFLSTTLARQPINPAAPADLALQVVVLAGAPLVLALIGAVRLLALRRLPALAVLVLLAATVVAPLQQIRIGEATSLGKHLAFGLVLAAPLIGAALEPLAAIRHRVLARIVTALVLLVVAGLGVSTAIDLRTSWVADGELADTVRPLLDGSPALGERPAGERYLLQDDLEASALADTYYFAYDGETGMPAYEAAVDDSYFGVIWLAEADATGTQIKDLVEDSGRYELVAEVPRVLQGEQIGTWSVYQRSEAGS